MALVAERSGSHAAKKGISPQIAQTAQIKAQRRTGLENPICDLICAVCVICVSVLAVTPGNENLAQLAVAI